jgi:hypothetical protein
MANILILALIAVMAILAPRPAHAYLDPGTGSLIFQVVIGAVLGGLFTLKMYFSKIKIIFLKIIKRPKNDK